MKVGSDSDFRDKFLLGAAKAFFVSAYADYCDAYAEDHGGEKCPLPMPGPREDWFDYAPAPPPAAFALAGELWAHLECENKTTVYALSQRARDADGSEPDPETFGHYLAMQYMGHGVSWFDDHERFDVVVPYKGVSSLSFDEATYHVGVVEES